MMGYLALEQASSPQTPLALGAITLIVLGLALTTFGRTIAPIRELLKAGFAFVGAAVILTVAIVFLAIAFLYSG